MDTGHKGLEKKRKAPGAYESKTEYERNVHPET